MNFNLVYSSLLRSGLVIAHLIKVLKRDSQRNKAPKSLISLEHDLYTLSAKLRLSQTRPTTILTPVSHATRIPYMFT